MKMSARIRFFLASSLFLFGCSLLFCGAGLAAEPYVIGALWDVTGHSSVIGAPSKEIADIWLEEVNKAGGINGHPIKIITYDTQSDTTKAVTFAKRLIEKDNVHAVVGPTTTGKAMACIPIVQKAKIAMVASVGGTPVVIPVKKWVFKAPVALNLVVEKQYDYMSKNTDIKKIGIISADIAFGRFGAKDSVKYAPKYGIEVVANEKFGPKDTDMTPQLMNIAKAGAQAVVCWTIGPTAPIVAKNMKQLGMKIPLYLCHGNTFPEHIEVAGDAAEGNIFAAIKPPIYKALPDSDPAKAMLTELIPRYNKIAGKAISVHGWHAWDCLKLVEQALRDTNPDPKNVAECRSKIRDGVEGVKNLLLTNGLFNMSPQDHAGTRPETALVMVIVKDGKFDYLAP